MAQVLINIDVDDLARATKFYCQAFDLRVGSRATPTASDERRYQRHWTPVHLDFVVQDIHTAVERARTAGATLEVPAATHRWGHIALLADPFGHGFCLIQFMGRGYDEIAGA